MHIDYICIGNDTTGLERMIAPPAPAVLALQWRQLREGMLAKRRPVRPHRMVKILQAAAGNGAG